MKNYELENKPKQNNYDRAMIKYYQKEKDELLLQMDQLGNSDG